MTGASEMSYQTPGLGFALGLQQEGHSWVIRGQSQDPPIADAAVMRSGWLGVNALLTDGDGGDIVPALCKEEV